MTIADNLAQIKARVAQAASRAGRDPQDIKLLVAGKYVGADELLQLIKAGQTLIGENRAQDLNRKYQIIGDQAEWHFIGHLQRNKVKDVVPIITMLHSLDSIRLADELEKQLTSISKTLPVLIEVNTSGEPSKSGVNPQGVTRLINYCRNLPHLKTEGLMTMGALVENPQDNRLNFQRLAQLAKTAGLPALSMGTSQDFEVAIEEGSTVIRLGRIVFSD